jgi:hypothetical protein
MSTTSRRLLSPATAPRLHWDWLLAIGVSPRPYPLILANLHPSPHPQRAQSLLKSYPSRLMIINIDHRFCQHRSIVSANRKSDVVKCQPAACGPSLSLYGRSCPMALFIVSTETCHQVRLRLHHTTLSKQDPASIIQHCFALLSQRGGSVTKIVSDSGSWRMLSWLIRGQRVISSSNGDLPEDCLLLIQALMGTETIQSLFRSK